MIPTHRQHNIHRISFTPHRRMSCIWVQWIFGLMWREGFTPHTTFWNLQSKPCPLCKEAHNHSIHGYTAFCPAHPLHKASLHAKRHDPAVHDWYTRARAIVGCLCIPESLYARLHAQHGRASARRRVFAFQHRALDLLMPLLQSQAPPDTPQGKRRRVSAPGQRVAQQETVPSEASLLGSPRPPVSCLPPATRESMRPAAPPRRPMGWKRSV